MEGPPLVGPPSGSVASSPPVLVSYTCTLRSAAVANTRPVPVTMRPPLTVIADPVPVIPSGSRRRSSPSPFCHAIAPAFRS